MDNTPLVTTAVTEAPVVVEDLRTSEQWSKDAAYIEVLVCDPDGWDRANFQYSWFEEPITRGEFETRRFKSTCIWGVEGHLADE